MIACLRANCPNGSRCVECSQTHFYCNRLCEFENGGCPAEQTCREVENESCDVNSQCCSRFNIRCSGKVHYMA